MRAPRLSGFLIGEGGGIEEPSKPAHRVGTCQRAATAIDDLRVADAVGSDAVVGTDIGHAHDSLNLHQLVALVQAHALLAADQQVAVAAVAGDDDGDLALEPLALGAVAGAVEVAAGLVFGLQDRLALVGARPPAAGRRAPALAA